MTNKALSGTILTLLLLNMLTLALNIQPVKASGTIHIRANGSVDPPTAPIMNAGNHSYTFTADIYDSIVVERSNILVDGADYTLQGTGSGNGFHWYGVNNVTIKNTNIKNFSSGIYVFLTSLNTFSGNNITNNGIGIGVDEYGGSYSILGNNITNNNWVGISLYHCGGDISGNNITNNGYGIAMDEAFSNISGNNITNNRNYGIHIFEAGGNISGNNITNNGYGGIRLSSGGGSISGNNITANNGCGIEIVDSSSCSIFGNSIAHNLYGIGLDFSSGNRIFHNNFINNVQQNVYSSTSVNVWDDGYPSGGNYWSDYTGVDSHRGTFQNETGSDGIGDTPYIIDANNRDCYPLMNSWTPTPPFVTASINIDPDALNLESKGQWITAYLQLPEGYNPKDIDASTIFLNGTNSPVLDPKYGFVTNSSESLVDYNNDGILERMVKFDRATVESFIYDQGITYGNVALTITGRLFDGTSFEGTDVISVNYGGDVNSDGTIDVSDILKLKFHRSGLPSGPGGYDSNVDINKDGHIDVFDILIAKGNLGQPAP